MVLFLLAQLLLLIAGVVAIMGMMVVCRLAQLCALTGDEVEIDALYLWTC
jgi:hypothetical protein